ncbi:chorismate mutase [Alkalithermobacter thermoalcaliphilus JW-YL-7 = DSM 7308]|uniref:chorismate mutase n=1 Tax=Alkalithermobacter thermoalcaliphilus JW-YL-7 = DSM 7308 TaxID=1121328 RepID=A0A150FQL2_CLOPD|nr:chorismate mutase [[Clostridium] paradoxum JW-YL-7 = DSM 7308]SHK79035.1 chorismate mutase [[Clostridium] paradoxum JW-YL-7 = DSM 7308]
MRILAIRGATTVNQNTKEEILLQTQILVEKIIKLNQIKEEDIISIIFTMTNDLDAAYPSEAIRENMKILNTPMLNFEEKYVKGSLDKCIRVLMHINSNKSKKDIIHVYLNEAKNLRTDLATRSEIE